MTELTEYKRDIVHLMEVLAVLRFEISKPEAELRRELCLELIASAFKAMQGRY